ncbi:MAG: cobalamin-dependent protein, partial [Planctomycetota bacterium]
MKRLLFVQLPHLGTDPRDPSENLPVAALYLRAALLRSGEGWGCESLPEPVAQLTPRGAADWILQQRFHAVVFTLYLWNLELSLAVMKILRRQAPHLSLLAGGPEVARDNHHLLRSRLAHVLIEGEGEVSLPAALEAIGAGLASPNRRVGFLEGGGYRWGRGGAD